MWIGLLLIFGGVVSLAAAVAPAQGGGIQENGMWKYLLGIGLIIFGLGALAVAALASAAGV